MTVGRIEGIAIKGIACALPTEKISLIDLYEELGKETVDKIIIQTGINHIYKSSEQQTASDLAFFATKKILEEKDIDLESIGALVFVTQTPDYKVPATAFVLHHRLELSKECLCFDINLGSTGFISGLHSISSIMKTSDIKRALLLVGETPSKIISSLDKSATIAYGDCGAAILLEKDPLAKPMMFKFKSFGEKFKTMVTPAGGLRNLDVSKERVMSADGNIRSWYDFYVNEKDAFEFAVKKIPSFIKEFILDIGMEHKDYDYFIFNQENQCNIKQIVSKLKWDNTKVLLSLDQYGNTGVSAIPLTLADSKFQLTDCGGNRLLMLSFGGGLSMAAVDLELKTEDILPVYYTDEFFLDGSVSHE